ncbi:MAG: sensor histidine kinase [Planctomycetota bacterium]|jgi:PAS domain S-box-containing protein
MSLILNGRITYEFLITGGVVSLIVASILILVVAKSQNLIFEKDVLQKEVNERMRDFEEVNASLMQENTKRRLAEERIISLIDALPDLIYFKDTASRNLVVNLSFEKFTGLKKEEAEGKTDMELLPPALAEHCKKQDEEVIRSGKLMRYEEEHTFHGEKMFQETIKVPLYDERGVVTGLVGITRDITERKKAEKQVMDSLKEKEVLLQEIHHRVKNNMQVIISLLRLQSRYLKDKDAVVKFTESQDRIRSMALIHENLYGSSNLAEIDFRKYVSDLAKSLKQSLESRSKGIDMVINTDEISLNMDTAIPCGLVINELVTNSFKHAFPDERDGEITIGAIRNDTDEIVLTVADNGIGMPEEIDTSSPGTLGLELIQLLVQQQLRGKIEINRENGTEFRITLKELHHKPRT